MLTTRIDPTRTSLQRRAFEADMRRRLRALLREIVEAIVGQDAFGLSPAPVVIMNVGRQEWRFRTDEEKTKAFQKWLSKMVDEKILTTDASGKPWTAKYIESAYKKGALRAFLDSRAKKVKKSSEHFEGTKEEFLRSSFGAPERLSKAKVLATRAFEDLRGVTSSMASQLNKVLADGLIKGSNPRTIAKAMAKNVRGITKARALTIARTEIIHAHAEGQLDAFEDLGEDVGVLAEWSTAGDDRVCPQCQSKEGKVYTVAEARGLIPLHPNCRCAWIPAEQAKQRKRLAKRRKR